MSDMETRGSVILGICHQDPERWRQFDAIYRPMLFSFVRRRGLREVEADQVVQDVFVKLLDKIQTYDQSRYRFRTWLFRVTRNLLIDRIRRGASYKKALEGWAGQFPHEAPSESSLIEGMSRDRRRRNILKHALRVVRASVSPRAWTCFEQRLLRDRPASEIAAELDIEPNAVYVHACRVMKKVRAICDEFDQDVSHAFDSEVS
jgi:RNA polymerase sigma-70 factor, ECF subfamily